MIIVKAGEGTAAAYFSDDAELGDLPSGYIGFGGDTAFPLPDKVTSGWVDETHKDALKCIIPEKKPAPAKGAKKQPPKADTKKV